MFFDDLGPPWPKHHCTDNPREPVAPRGVPARRTRGMMQELIEAANTAGLFSNKVFGRRIPTEWTLLLVLTVDRDGDESSVRAEFLDSQSGETTQFKCRSDEPVFGPGDFINIKGKEISFVHKTVLIPITFTDGAWIVVPEKSPEPPSPAPPPSLAALGEAKPKTPFPKRNKPADYSRSPMTEAEMVHFNSDAVGLGDLLAKLEPLVKAYAREMTRKPVDVSLRLNAEGHKTADGVAWTPRLVHFLLALIFNGPKPDRNPEPSPTGPAGLARGRTARPGAVKISMDDKDELAKLLSGLGRVTVKH